jgi:uncharacterized protein (TIGR03382 family)
MRTTAALALLSLSSLSNPAAADEPPPLPSIVVHGARHAAGPATPGPTTVSRLLYLNDCKPNGCYVYPGYDDSRTNRSSIISQTALQDPYPWGTAHWDQLVQCVRDTYAPFDIEIVTEDPGPSVDHFEVMIAGDASQIYPGAGGVAPFVPCNGQLQDNVISFVFAETTSSVDTLCWFTAQEAGHVYGMDHEMEENDPMTYLYPPYHKEFTDVDAPCGEFSHRQCLCGGFYQNSYQYMLETFGPRAAEPPMVTITSPLDGQWVQAGFAVHAAIAAPAGVDEAALLVDGARIATATSEPWVFATPADLASGAHQLGVEVTAGGATATASVGVNVIGRCADGACADGYHCSWGYCLPGADTAGGLGAACTTDADCIAGECWPTGDTLTCTTPCEPGRACPTGFHCAGAGGGVCLPGDDAGGGDDAGDRSGGGCSSGGGGALSALAALALLARRRRRRAAMPT